MPTDLTGFQPLVALMHRIKASGKEMPRVRLAFHDHPLYFSVASDKSRYPGCVNLTDGGSYGQNKWYGRITVDGVFTPAEAARNLEPADKAELWALLKRLRDEDAEPIFAEYGKRLGLCCICGRELTNEKSVSDGMGPICRQKAFGKA